MKRFFIFTVVFAMIAGGLAPITGGRMPSALAAEETLTFPAKLPVHPRLFLTVQREKEIKEQISTDVFLKKLVSELIKKADRAKKDKLTEYVIPDGKRLLGSSRRSLERTSVLAFAYRMTGDKTYADAALAEMLAVCRFKDWNPSHYLDTGEMATAVGIGYDWLYDFIPVKERNEIKDAVVKHALNTGLPIYEKNNWWTKSNNNWNEVCNAGLTIGALAVADEEPQLAEKIVRYAVKSLPNGLSAYKPDGAYPEGPVYWGYGASFTGLMLKVLDDVFKNDFGLLKAEGLNITGDYYMSVIGPNYRNFNYADAGDTSDSSPMMFALSTFYNRPDYAVWIRNFLERMNRYQHGRLAVFHAIWYNPAKDDKGSSPPLAQKFTGIQDVCTMRTEWNNPDAAFLGFKGGNNRANHGHLDIGSFVYEVNGVRWAVDLGTDDYNMPGYFGKQRWDYFRLNNKSHNTLVIGDKIQNPTADCKIVSLRTGKNAGISDNIVAFASVDMTDAYKEQVKTAQRFATLLKDGTVLIQDTVIGAKEPVRWGMMTRADIKLDGKTAILSQDGKKIRLEMTTLYDSEKFEIVSAKPPTKAERQNEGYQMLTIVSKPKGENEKVHIAVTMKPEK
ncbi:MAG: heparinase II/III family protein [Planctomycetaceae bacterium]|nr:heparinase II/III family protein [Planctomycetaceae bacterium]